MKPIVRDPPHVWPLKRSLTDTGICDVGDNGGTTDTVHNISYDVSICIPGQTNFTGFINHFRMPSTESKGLGNFWYSFDSGMTHYVQIDTETDLGHGLVAPDEPGGSEGEDSGPFSTIKNAQLNWLQNDLQSVNRSVTPWVVVGQSYASFVPPRWQALSTKAP